MSTNSFKCEVLMIFSLVKRSRRPLVYQNLKLENLSLPFVVECQPSHSRHSIQVSRIHTFTLAMMMFSFLATKDGN